MKKIENNSRKRKALLFLPVLFIPFVTLAFWALGGGRPKAQKHTTASGLNLQLPEPHLKEDKGESKMSFYDEMEKDTQQKEQKEERDAWALDFSDTTDPFGVSMRHPAAATPSLKSTANTDVREKQVYERLAQLKQQLKEPPATLASSRLEEHPYDRENQMALGAVQGMDDQVGQPVIGDSGEDTEMNHLNQMMDKILDIQHPERVDHRLREINAYSKEPVATINPYPSVGSVSLLDTGKERSALASAFYSWEQSASQRVGNAIAAIVPVQQVLVSGAVIKLRLSNNITINGELVPKGTDLYGIASLNGERLEVPIISIRSGDRLFSVHMEVYDMDGLPGIYVPGTITRDVAKSSIDNASQMLEVTSLDPSLKAQAATAGLNAVKSLISKKAKLIKVTVKAGYKVLLKSTENK